MTQQALLAQGIAEMGLLVDGPKQEKLLTYMALLQKWNKVYNLTAIRDAEEMVRLHLLDSLSVLPYVQGKNLLDVGSGGGLPGIVLAIVRPDLQVTTIDTVQKKAIFMRQVKGELGLGNLMVVHDRVENFQPETKFDMIISRAFSELGLFIQLTRHLIAPRGRWLAMKGQVPADELAKIDKKTNEIIELKVPGLDAERHLIVFEEA